jgi:hypothetical protein
MSNGKGGPPLTPNQKIVNWSNGHLGRKAVRRRDGKGECWDLAEEALEKSGAQGSRDLGSVEEDTDYIWGDPIQLKDVQPGDIIQLRNHLITTTTVTHYSFPDGSYFDKTKTRTQTRPHHTVIVRTPADPKGMIRTYEQYVNAKLKGNIVQSLELYTRDVDPVKTEKVERRRNPFTNKLQAAKVTETVTIKVTGSMWPYHPKPKH